MAVTRSDVARLAGVAPAVVSYVLNHGPRPVEAAIRKLDYRPNAIASALRGGSTRSIGFLTPNQRNPSTLSWPTPPSGASTPATTWC